jgi:hypothetical protein
MLMKYDVTDEEILAYYRRNHDPYITLEAAKKHWHYTRRWWHLAEGAKRREQASRRAAKLEQNLRTTICSPSHSPLSLAERYATGRPRRR